MSDEIIAEVKIQFTSNACQMVAITHKDEQLVEVEIEGLNWIPGQRWIEFGNLKITLVEVEK